MGPFDPSPAVEARLGSFQASIEQLLWPEKRAKDPILGDKVPGFIDRTTARSYLTIPTGFQPELLVTVLEPFRDKLRLVDERGDITIGPIPAGMPVGLISNIDLRPDRMGVLDRVKHDAKLGALLIKAVRDLRSIPENADDETARKAFAELVEPLLELSKCKDFVVNRGHYFGTDRFAEEPGLSDGEKRDLIEFLKTL